eukprot:CAMPEP_0119041338 /NCGR_PEP_ID=MMETSP1177-20130426/11562_1 /TAXON_ID=2985 /ORGANISM="Ochromonas sp, Strain CCMP1899" /LENGTH=238 /DNA_ID=CAMNT_0007007309 /DNA_START=160 /DNA_END=876 /DNA_ORIENTATION=-
MASDGSSGSPLPAFDDIIKTSATNVVSKVNASPLVDRALDSALDFLQDGEAETEEEEDDEFDLFDIYEESPDFDTPYDLIAELEEKDQQFLANKLPSAEETNQAVINADVARWRKHDKDCGSAEVQVSIANTRIKYLTKHLLANKHDASCRRGLQTLVTQRRKFLNFLYETNQPKAVEMIKALGIRFRPPGRAWDKTAKYGAYKNTKSKWFKLRNLARSERNIKKAAKAEKEAALASA